MRIMIEFGYPGHKREVSWWKDFSLIPKKMIFNDEVWEGFMYDTGKVGSGHEWHYYFTKAKDQTKVYYDPMFGYPTYVPKFEDVFDLPLLKCECGAIYTSFPQVHMFMCAKWEPMTKKDDGKL